MRPAGAVDHRFTGPIPVGLAFDRGPRALKPSSELGDRHILIYNELGYPETMTRSQRRASVGHEGSLCGELVPRQLHSTAGSLPTSPDHTPSINVSGQYF